MSFVVDIQTRLVAQGLGVVGTSIFVTTGALIPSGDGPYISLAETGGIAPTERHDRVGNPYKNPSLQIVVRAAMSDIARQKIHDIYVALVGVRNLTINSTNYLWIRPVQEPFDMQPDGRGRARFAFNITARSA